MILHGVATDSSTDVVREALSAVLAQVDGSVRMTSLHVALLTEELLARGCEVGGVRREVSDGADAESYAGFALPRV